jgi:hypothetical protein
MLQGALILQWFSADLAVEMMVFQSFLKANRPPASSAGVKHPMITTIN